MLNEQVRKFMEENKMSQVKTAKMMGIAESTFSRWLNGDYPNPENIEPKIEEFFEKYEQRKTSNKGANGFVYTEMSSEIWNALDYYRTQRCIGCIFGDAGIGKTRTITEWAKDKSDVIIITARPVFSGSKAFAKLLANQLKARNHGSCDDIYTDDQLNQPDNKSYTQEDITKLQEKFEVDKQAAIEEALKKAKMTADEKAKYEQETKLKEIEEREKQIALRELKADAAKILAQKNIPSNRLDFLVGEDLEKTKSNIDSFKVEFDKALQTQLEERLKGKAPSLSNINSNNTIEEQFKKALG